MSEPIPFDEHAERLKIRSSPKPVTRINRKVLMVGAGLGVLGLFAAMSIALKPPKAADPADRHELYNTTNTRKPEGLSALPASYSELASAQDRITRLGPPLSGDLGATMLQAERDLGIEPEYVDRFENDFRPNPADEAERARRMREAALADEAAKAPVFFRLQSETGSTSAKQGTSSPRDPALDIGSELLALAALPQGTPSAFGGPADSNLQGRKLAFASESADSDIYNPHRVEDPLSPYQVMAGTLIPASLVTGINSDLPGTIVAQVTQPVYDTVTGHYVLIPQGSRLIGRYQSEVSFGQDRALVTWDRIIFPDGASISISAPGADAQGYAGLADRTDHHWDRVFVAAGLATILGVGAELGNDGEGNLERAIRRGTTDTVNQAGQRVVERNLGIQPTIRVRPGWPVRVVVTRDLILRPH
ncbi:MAG TPA: conjugal transfer protein TrbI [Hyphomonas sp.]|uniref:TrbI/VirB10 family protein n=1 Tax=Hyphomonas sp. UBA5107 TaxID=1946636 RepID=UPI000C4E0FDA|nr:TrbI/VirB10 family protein [Hyphomonas sp. UBA5107]MAN65866.1 conjugal transfer protein TrbI [Hyphomonadaceae bacterium]HBL92129.1 conjugal transfer protein TrbI [Hyphomonas sp.]HCJ17686.1 conjugal transfer protein TrbI [Hyphomonas sp.]HCN93049.1 conjugal transfer protein TrbI [Hyphomonas sp.]|tara:strand:- start:708 stop:1967 length:1260 start_codon:yes stop_codon:yes gene_type:complete